MRNTQIPCQAKKHLGQHFLHDAYIIDTIIQASAELFHQKKHSKLIEIGIGLGDLSERLLSIANLTAYEIDANLCSFVLQKFSSRAFKHAFSLIHNDVLAIPFIRHHKQVKSKQASHAEDKKGWLSDTPYIVVSNLPYNIATRVVLNLLLDSLCEGFIVMTQKEVAQKFCANTYSRDFCALSVIGQSVGEISMLFDVDKTSFTPMPKVTSSVFRHKKYEEHIYIEDDFERMLKAAFSAPRKKLATNLLPFFQQFGKKHILDTIFAQETMNNVRPHEISTQQYHHIYNTLKETL